MIKRVIFFFVLQCFVFVPAQWAAEKSAVVAAETAVDLKQDKDAEDQMVNDFLSDPKNPFLKLTPKKKVVVKPSETSKPTPVPEPKLPEKVDLSKDFKISCLVLDTPHPQAVINDNVVSEKDYFIIINRQIKAVGVDINMARGHVFYNGGVIDTAESDKVEFIKVLKIDQKGVLVKSQDGSSFLLQNEIK